MQNLFDYDTELQKYPKTKELIFSNGIKSVQKYLKSELHQKFIDHISTKERVAAELHYKFNYDKNIANKTVQEIFHLKCLHKNNFLKSYKLEDFAVDLDSDQLVSLDEVISLLSNDHKIIASEVISRIIKPRLFSQKVSEITLSNKIFPILSYQYLETILFKRKDFFGILVGILDLYDRITRKVSHYYIDKNQFIKSTKCYWFQRRFGYEDVADLLTNFHSDFVEKELTPKPDAQRKAPSYPTQSDTVYIWRSSTENLYKIGRCYQGRLKIRVNEVARRNDLTIQKVWAKNVGRLSANFCEQQLLNYGVKPKSISSDGFTEFRTLNKKQFSSLLEEFDTFAGTKLNFSILKHVKRNSF